MMFAIWENSFLISQLLLFVSILVIFFSGRNLITVHTGSLRRMKKKKPGKASPQGNLGFIIDNGAFKQFEGLITPADPEKTNELRHMLMKAGYRKPSAIKIFFAWRVMLSIGALIFCALVLPLLMAGQPLYITLLATILILLIGYFAPGFWVERTYQYRKMIVEKGFPDALDLLLVCIEAGNGFDQALNRVARELETTNKVLADELLVITRELRAGKDRYRVLEDFVGRTGVEDITSFITVIKQADKFGVSIAEALRVYSGEMRNKRYMKAEEKANIMPVKLALGAIVFTVPPAIIVMVGPSVLLILRHLGELNS